MAVMDMPLFKKPPELQNGLADSNEAGRIVLRLPPAWRAPFPRARTGPPRPGHSILNLISMICNGQWQAAWRGVVCDALKVGGDRDYIGSAVLTLALVIPPYRAWRWPWP
jgi:hypothetical protein